MALSPEAEALVIAQAKAIGFSHEPPCSCDQRDPVLIAGDGVHLPYLWCAWCRHRIPDTPKENDGS